MKATFKKGLSLLLVMQVLLASVGLPVYSHTCRVMGLTELSVFDSSGCCSKEKAEPKASAQGDDCCDLSLDHVHADLDAVFSSVLQFCFAVFTFAGAITLPEWPSLEISESIILQQSDSSPPHKLHGRLLLQFIQILLI